MITWKIAVANSPPSDILSAQIPRSLASSARSVRDELWLCV
jgi:hypothetical protein